MLDWLSGAEVTPPPLIKSENFLRVSWFAFVALGVETVHFRQFEAKMNEYLMRDSKTTLEEAFKVSFFYNVAPYRVYFTESLRQSAAAVHTGQIVNISMVGVLYSTVCA